MDRHYQSYLSEAIFANVSTDDHVNEVSNESNNATQRRVKSVTNFISYIDENDGEDLDGEQKVEGKNDFHCWCDEEEDSKRSGAKKLGRKRAMSSVGNLRKFSIPNPEEQERKIKIGGFLQRSQSSREVRLGGGLRGRFHPRQEERRSFDEGVKEEKATSAGFLKTFGLKRTLTMSSVVSGWNKSFRQKMAERAQSFRNLDKKGLSAWNIGRR